MLLIIVTHAFAFVMGVILAKPFGILVKKLQDDMEDM